jgi:pathogenesis-related protein 1
MEARSADAIVGEWAAEAKDFDPRSARCAAGAVCTHYTQIVWRATSELGCASARCDQDSPFGRDPWFLTVCSYAPAGNLRGARPY